MMQHFTRNTVRRTLLAQVGALEQIVSRDGNLAEPPQPKQENLF